MTTATTIAAAHGRLWAALGCVLVFCVIIAWIDNYVRLIAEDGGLWQFHAIRAVMALVLVAAFARPLGLRIRPRNPRAVAVRAAIHAVAMLIYFGSLAFLPVAQVAAGLYTAPIFVLLILRLGWGRPLGPVRVLAVVVGFAGAVMVLTPAGGLTLHWGMIWPLVAAALYALGNILTREWCANEPPEAITVAFFVAFGIAGVLGMAALALWPQDAAEGAAGFVLRGAVWPTPRFLALTLLQAAGSLIAVSFLMRAYQIAEPGRVAVFEYAFLPIAALFGWLIWAERIGPLAWAGMALIAAAGAMIALKGERR